ncbi:uncharacterized protein LOC115045866 [Echeneis naucrates]|uniref:uncharacterized protein LOC115045866 n=1 Tax=Echeneis naucrates TaxID=173247 RepID=UPI0011141539|nr:uncharacterized protein LOC115045866 [Echeneis naucrates]
MESMKSVLNGFLTQLRQKASVFVVMISIFCHHIILKHDLECTCENQGADCWMYMITPACIFFLITLLLDKVFSVICRLKLANCHKGTCCVVCCHVMKAVLIGLLWCVSVLIDGDWYACCFGDKQSKLACQSQLTDDERVLILKLKNESRIIGLSSLLSITLLATLISSVPWRWYSAADRFNKKVHFDKIILEQGQETVTKRLREAADKMLNEKLDVYLKDKKWAKCVGVTEEVINETADVVDVGQATEADNPLIDKRKVEP